MQERTAILFSGSAYNIRFSLDSLLKNVVIPNNADVFVLTTRLCKRRKTVSSSPIPDCDVDWESYRKKNEQTILDATPLSDDEIQLIRDTFGDRLKGLWVAEDMPEYWEYIIQERIKMKDAINLYSSYATSRGEIAPFAGDVINDHNTGSIRYTSDQYRYVKKVYEFMEEYEKANGFKYDYVMRCRIDFKAKEKIVIEHYTLNHDDPTYLYVMGSVRRDIFPWMDEFSWFSKRKAASILFPTLDRMGLIVDRKYNTVHTPQQNDFRFSPETQFDLLLRELNMKVINVRIYRSQQYSTGGDGFDYFNYRFRRDKPIDLDYEYELVKNCKTDINEHVETLKRYGEECDSIVEIGCRYGISTVAFMASKKPFISYDVQYNNKIDYLKLIAKENNLPFEFRLENPTPENGESLIPECDLLFIDSNHHSVQLAEEFRQHAHKVKKYIIMHDTTTFYERGAGDDHIEHGMKLAIEPFLANNRETWRMKERFMNNNGLMILERI